MTEATESDPDKKKRVEEIVIGQPLRMDGHRGTATSRVEVFADRLRKALPYGVKIVFVDERLTSVAAEQSLGLQNKQKTREEKKLVDQIAAVAILQDYLNTLNGPDAWLLPEE